MFLLKTFIVVLIPSILTFLEPDTGVVIIYFIIYISMLFASGIRLRWFIILGGIILLAIGLVLGCYFTSEKLFVSIFGNNLYYDLKEYLTGKVVVAYNLKMLLLLLVLLGYLVMVIIRLLFIFQSLVLILSLLFLLVILDSWVVFYFYYYYYYLMERYSLFAIKKIPLTDKFVLAGIIGMLIFQQIQNIGMTIGSFTNYRYYSSFY